MKEPKAPLGTVALLLVFIVMYAALFTNIYLTMLSRGVTQ